MPDPTPRRSSKADISTENYDWLLAEAQAPYRTLRRFFYGAFAASGAIGAFVFFFQVLAGHDLGHTAPSLALQLGVVALMAYLFKADRHRANG